jgi:paraquat-inducible protein A
MTQTATKTVQWVACRDCGLVQHLPPRAEKGHTTVCSRCHHSFGNGRAAYQAALALAITAGMLFALAQLFPLMEINLQGLSQAARIASSVIGLAEHDLSPLAAMVLAVSIGVPLFRMLVTTYVLFSLQRAEKPAYLAKLFRVSENLRAWAMLDVYLLGALIALTKLHDLARIDVDAGFWALGLVVLALAALDVSFDRRAIWDALKPPAVFAGPPDARAILSCHSCGYVHVVGPSDEVPERCERCAAKLHMRKPDSVSRTWALVLTGLILYVPANAYPVLTVISFGHGSPSTIMGGVLELLNGNDWPLAVIVFLASIAVPVLKLVGLAVLLISVQRRWRMHPIDRTRLYRLIEFIGRWSTIDIFVAALLTALVTLGQVATIEPGMGVLAFGGVVVATMFAAESFDPRLIWDVAEDKLG